MQWVLTLKLVADHFHKQQVSELKQNPVFFGGIFPVFPSYMWDIDELPSGKLT